MGTPFSAVYNHFLGLITDDMYMELTPEDTIQDLQRLLIHAIPNFEFPRKNLNDYEIRYEEVSEDELVSDDFVLSVQWGRLTEDGREVQYFNIDKSAFNIELTSEEINILALLMMNGWLHRQIVSIEHVRMKYSGSDFKFTSQANHLSKLLALKEETRREEFHYQRLYKRRKLNDKGEYESNWSVLREKSALR